MTAKHKRENKTQEMNYIYSICPCNMHGHSNRNV